MEDQIKALAEELFNTNREIKDLQFHKIEMTNGLIQACLKNPERGMEYLKVDYAKIRRDLMRPRKR